MKCVKKCLDIFFIKRFCCQSFSCFQLRSIAIHSTIVLLMFSWGFQNTLYDSRLVLFVPNSWAVNGIVKLKHIRKARLFSFSLATPISREQSWWKVYAHYLCTSWATQKPISICPLVALISGYSIVSFRFCLDSLFFVWPSGFDLLLRLCLHFDLYLSVKFTVSDNLKLSW